MVISYQGRHLANKLEIWENLPYADLRRKFSEMPEPDPIEEAHRQVQEITDSDPVNGEELLGSPDLRRQLREAKERLRKEDSAAKPPGE